MAAALAEAENRIALDISLGVCRAFLDRGSGVLTEFTLANGRRADVIALDRDGRLTIVEIKSCRADFQSDRKWQDYLEFCDSFYFAVAADFPIGLLPAETGLMIADRWGAHIERHPEPVPLAGARRKAVLLRFALNASQRLRQLVDPPI
ncbi:MAG: MmcB family DNA repair protein [Proteobacteria bacterium]|nr:MmcB family DNA repair protein [Pseudomonadota bacterium]MBI3500085.1 MmcB family DNA repair protein [Pseudomonadota bacterium]